MSALGFVMETVFLWLGPFFPFFLVFWVILNVSRLFVEFDLRRALICTLGVGRFP